MREKLNRIMHFRVNDVRQIKFIKTATAKGEAPADVLRELMERYSKGE